MPTCLGDLAGRNCRAQHHRSFVAGRIAQTRTASINPPITQATISRSSPFSRNRWCVRPTAQPAAAVSGWGGRRQRPIQRSQRLHRGLRIRKLPYEAGIQTPVNSGGHQSQSKWERCSHLPLPPMNQQRQIVPCQHPCWSPCLTPIRKEQGSGYRSSLLPACKPSRRPISCRAI
jgi:hypothetical protein